MNTLKKYKIRFVPEPDRDSLTWEFFSASFDLAYKYANDKIFYKYPQGKILSLALSDAAYNEDRARELLKNVIMCQDDVTHLNEMGYAYSDDTRRAIVKRDKHIGILLNYLKKVL